jgi:hypothetical protein
VISLGLNNKKIICNISDDLSNYWTHSLVKEYKLHKSTNHLKIFHSEIFDFYLINFDKNDFSFVISIINDLTENNYVHFILSDFKNVNDLINYFDNLNSNNFNYSILNYFSEVLFDDDPIPLNKLKKLKYFFTSTNALSKENGVTKSKIIESLGDRYILDYKYSLIYFYIKLGFCYFQKGEHLLENCNRFNKVFMYTKSKDANREKQISLALSTNKIYQKIFDDNDWYWYYNNYNNYHIPFIIDYNICKLNIVQETNPIVLDNLETDSHFLSEKTLKAIMVSTPSYVLLQKDVYNSLIDYGFYFVNEEFGKYSWENYEAFCNFLKNCDDNDIDLFYQNTKVRSQKNKLLLEKYVFSDKEKEISLLLKF